MWEKLFNFSVFACLAALFPGVIVLPHYPFLPVLSPFPLLTTIVFTVWELFLLCFANLFALVIYIPHMPFNFKTYF